MKKPFINKDKKTSQIVYVDVVEWANENIVGANFAERIENLMLNWIDTKGKSPAEIWWDDIRGKTLLDNKIREVIKEVEAENNGRTI